LQKQLKIGAQNTSTWISFHITFANRASVRDDVLLFTSSHPVQYLFKEAGPKQRLKDVALDD
jgi:hypothetical protein